MAGTLVDVSDDVMGIPVDNPEAVFDFLTIQSLRGRYGNTEGTNQTSNSNASRGFQSETDFETYVQQFPIDDTISQCFATAATKDTADKKLSSLFISGGKRPDPSNQKLRKKFGRKPADDLDEHDADRVRDPKRSKPGGVFGKRHKWLSTKYESSKGSRRHNSSSDQSEADIAQGVLVLNGQTENNVPDSNSTSDSQITSYSEVFMRNEHDQVVPCSAGNVAATSTLLRPGAGAQRKPNFNPTPQVKHANDKFSALISGDSSHMIQQLEDLSPTEATGLRDEHGHTLLHRSVLAGSDDAVKFLLEKYPEMAAEINAENLTAVELAAKIGHYDCLKVMLDRNRKSLSVSLINRLLTITSQWGQVGCLKLLLQRLSCDAHSAAVLPRDPRGNTAAHLAAKHGHLNCLQSLVAAGYDVSTENLLGQTPLHVAHQSRQQACFEYLLLLHVAQRLVRMLQQRDLEARSDAGSATLRDSVLDCFQRFNDLVIETQQMLADCKVSIMQTLERLQNDLELFIRHTATDSATKRQEAREKLSELAGEIERLEDTLEFSPLLEKEGALSRLLASVTADIARADTDVIMSNAGLAAADADTLLRSLIKDIHKEFLLENWSVDHIYSKYLSRDSKSQSPVLNSPSNPTSSLDHTSDSNPNFVFEAVTDDRPHTLVRNGDYTNTGDGSFKISTQVLSNEGQNETSNTPDVAKSNVNETLAEANIDSIAAGTGGSNYSFKCQNHELEHSKASDRNGNSNSFSTDNSNIEQSNDISDNRSSHGDKAKAVNDSTTADNDTIKTEPEPTERPFTKLLSLDERIDLLIAGERAREKTSDDDTVVSGEKSVSGERTGSVYTTTFTSITSESTSGLSDWYTKLALNSLESSPEDLTGEVTSDSASYWWDQGEERQARWTARQHFSGLSPNVKQQIHLQLESEEPSYEELRRQRLISHLRAVEQTRQASDNFCERITTSTGEVMGGFERRGEGDNSDRIVVDVTGALRKRSDIKPMPKPRGLGRQKLFTLEDAIATNPQPPNHQRNHGNSSPTMKWEDMSFTDDDEESISWYEMESRDRRYYRSGTSTDRSTTPQSYV